MNDPWEKLLPEQRYGLSFRPRRAEAVTFFAPQDQGGDLVRQRRHCLAAGFVNLFARGVGRFVDSARHRIL
jgi:hypothetical protein